MKSAALFVTVRAVFISLTHLAVPPPRVAPDQNDLTELLAFLSSDGDLFFSGHTGLPLLMALIFWDRRSVRMGFVAATALEGISVLLAHIHYSIDVLGALFITPTILRLAERWFPRDRALARTHRCPSHPRSRGTTGRARGTAVRRKQHSGDPLGVSSGTQRHLGSAPGPMRRSSDGT